jgi:uncharacterized membrane protein YgcG
MASLAIGLAALGSALAASVALAPPPAAAQHLFSERIDRYLVGLHVERNGDLLVDERITYDFGSQERHGLIRQIPYRFAIDGDREHDRITPISDIRVTATGASSRFTTSRGNRIFTIKIGDADRTVTGTHTYRIRYRVRGALNHFTNHDEVYWNAIGNQWSVAVADVRVTVTGPAAITDVACYHGADGSGLGCDGARVGRGVGRFTQARLWPYEGLTVVAAFPRGAVRPTPTPILVERWTIQRAFTASPATLGLAAGVVAAGLSLIALALWRVGRDRAYVGSAVDQTFGSVDGSDERIPVGRRTDVTVEFVPPEGLRPGQVGTLVDETANPLDVTATIVDLAVRGYLRIDEEREPKWFRQGDWRLVKLRDPDDALVDYERKLLAALFRSGDQPLLSDLKNTFAADLRKVQDALYADATSRGWFVRRPDRVRTLWVALSWVAFAAAVALAVLLAATTRFGWAGVAAVVVAVAFVAVSRKMPARTAKGTAALRRVLGFRLFIMESERERARFAENRHLFSEYLPYAIVFGAVDRWAKAFEGLGGEPPPVTWYTGGDGFRYAVFAHSISSFSTVTTGTVASTPAGSGASGFSGGSSGGGFGGGGGSSW